ncbi:MAG: class I SAM-dependent methyltransferase [Pyrinomonadaceae bacterium]
MTDTIERFSNRVENYIKYRPGYPAGVLRLFREEMGLVPGSVVADIGSGPGVSTRMFLENGNTVYAVEPNDAMRAAAEHLLGHDPNFKSVKGTAEATALPDASADIVTAAQAFHWFDRERARREFQRILKPGGWVALIWNLRLVDGTPFLGEYERFLLDHATDYAAVRHDNITEDEIREFFGSEYGHAVFDNVQVFDFAGLRGRMFSASYMPAERTPAGERAEKELRLLFDSHQRDGRIEVRYNTNIYYSKF